MNQPVNRSMLAAECRALWRAVYAARVANDGEVPPEAAAIEGDLAVTRYLERYHAKEKAA